jgi:FKBP-type peptidyl-prolyl cis-trans isomerase
MKSLVAAAAAFAVCLGLVSCEAYAGGGKPAMKTVTDSASYAIGVNIGKNMQRDSVNLNPDLIAAGIRDVLANKALLNDEQLQACMTSFQQELQSKQQERQAASAKLGEKFLADNAKKPGVVTLPSGLQYQVITEGSGPMPKADDEVVTKYRGTLVDGTEFDASEKHGGTATFKVNQVIPGWTEALQKMKVGSKWKLFIPSNLAYGQQGMPPQIGPNSALVFDIELLKINDAASSSSTDTSGGK